MPNPHHDPSTGQFTNAPDPNQPPEGGGEGQQPDPWAAVREAGITPEQALQGGRLYADLNNLDRRQQALQQVIRPDIDTWIGQQGQGQEEPDPFEQFGDPEEPYGYEPEPQAQHQPAFNPQEFARQVVELAKGESTKEIQNWLQGMMQAQQVTETATSVAKEVGLPASDAQFIEHQVKMLSEQQPNRAPADIAREVAQARANELAQ